jgi:CheY-like chemotaxis protein
MTLHWPETAHMRVMIVNHEPEIVEYLSELLKSLPHPPEIEVAYDGFDAGMQVMTFHPQVILLDLMMLGINGFTVCKLIKTNPQTRAIRIIAMTGHPTTDKIERALSAGAEACISKPINEIKLLSLLNLGDSQQTAYPI